MANSVQNVSDEQLENASGGKVVYNPETKLYDIIDNDDGYIVGKGIGNEGLAKMMNSVYLIGKAKGHLKGLGEGKEMNDRFISNSRKKKLI